MLVFQAQLLTSTKQAAAAATTLLNVSDGDFGRAASGSVLRPPEDDALVKLEMNVVSKQDIGKVLKDFQAQVTAERVGQDPRKNFNEEGTAPAVEGSVFEEAVAPEAPATAQGAAT